ncbi:hypothetical protein K438DRAFT_1177095 [Mycena galopus ATCC 62051]|nr:hypothetical protein K438DRAFT_1177095 [Mycena galopus ATCC 62051]
MTSLRCSGDWASRTSGWVPARHDVLSSLGALESFSLLWEPQPGCAPRREGLLGSLCYRDLRDKHEYAPTIIHPDKPPLAHQVHWITACPTRNRLVAHWRQTPVPWVVLWVGGIGDHFSGGHIGGDEWGGHGECLEVSPKREKMREKRCAWSQKVTLRMDGITASTATAAEYLWSVMTHKFLVVWLACPTSQVDLWGTHDDPALRLAQAS